MEKQRNIAKHALLVLFVVFYVLITTITILALFFNFGDLYFEYKTRLFTAFILEVAVVIVVLFYSFFEYRRSYDILRLPRVDSKSIHDVNVVKNSPIGADVFLNKDVDLLNSYNKSVKLNLVSEGFSTQFDPSCFVFVSNNTGYVNFRPTVEIQVEKNLLNQLNMSLSDYMDSEYVLTKEMHSIVGERQVRTSDTTALQWFRGTLESVSGVDYEAATEYIQYQKIVISNDLMGILTVSYGDEIKQKDKEVLQNLICDFGVKN